ncbi:hypothetical protein EFU53_000397 [Vibrio cholerae]|uniref:Uncharacterized protein n=1 Tax=Vibrio cholerae TaxID=666 RepID=A0A5C9SZR5_VIBCL|nr:MULTISPECIES: hypothetical protein [Vibrio]MCX9581336.1 hypothetical protein [Vibrio cholerae]MCX9585300.1 hypothetical protein [Vibrio cholerae]MDX5009390.1 hypothetical protein [Vibrio cholerae]MEB5520216.1 hypothetical protein [Vibrio cholerae]ORP10819.1 hypothetical protein B7947_14395 [Vibrio paracholerae]
MNTLKFSGFSNIPSECEYGIGEIGDKIAIVFYQRELIGTSITNMIEHLTIHVLATELQGKSPENIRVFEHYNPELNPIIEWQEVQFSRSGVVDERKSIITKLIELVFPSGNPSKYYVDSPVWSRVSDEDIQVLSKID